ncbi:ABC transporter ATP-binding protein [Microvirga brassicacearum]|uniref:ABC transporter ATP-binding protein n=1 Tax=Microvirga brassicacearum TaxID=2580413 RepID=A0A5N3PIG4_9HYPH|nr:ABC transporter ATP-binding protein [Microvirga brassicacearum]KAB0269473.1 ABC transporter ATP-binding protein [Microvirga brassicacearum]
MLTVENVTKRYGGLVAVNDASLKVQEGRIVALIGPNGAGKTTLFAMIGGFVRPDMGEIRFRDQDITGHAPHAICRLGLTRTFQIVQPFAGLSVLENIAVGAHLRHKSRADALERAAMIGEQVGMGRMLEQSAQSLTVAGRKRLELARALATEAKLLLLDEVMAGLIPSEIVEIVATIRKIRDSGVTILLIEHVMQAVMSLSEEAYVLNQGRMIAHGTPQQLVADPTVIEAYLGHGAADRLQQEGAHA